MQEYYDEQELQVKKLAKFDIEKEEAFKKLPVYEYLFHVWLVSDQQE